METIICIIQDPTPLVYKEKARGVGDANEGSPKDYIDLVVRFKDENDETEPYSERRDCEEKLGDYYVYGVYPVKFWPNLRPRKDGAFDRTPSIKPDPEIAIDRIMKVQTRVNLVLITKEGKFTHHTCAFNDIYIGTTDIPPEFTHFRVPWTPIDILTLLDTNEFKKKGMVKTGSSIISPFADSNHRRELRRKCESAKSTVQPSAFIEALDNYNQYAETLVIKASGVGNTESTLMNIGLIDFFQKYDTKKQWETSMIDNNFEEIYYNPCIGFTEFTRDIR